MKPCRAQPFYNYAIERLPTDSSLAQAVAEYLGMRLGKNPHLHPKEWEAAIDELVAGMRITPTKQVRPRQRVIGANSSEHLVTDLIYLFQVATSRGWNHIYFTREQDVQWSNMSYYQDPYWHKTVADRTKRQILKEELDGKSG